MPPAAVAHPPRCRSFTPAARRATRDALPGRPHPRPRRSSRSCDALVTRARWPAARPDRRALACRPAHLRGAHARRGRPGPALRVAAGAARQAQPTPRGWHQRPGPAGSSNHGSGSASGCRSGRCSASSTAPRADARARPPPPAPSCAASPATRARSGASPRTSSATPTPSRWPVRACPLIIIQRQLPHQPRHRLDLSPRHRQRLMVDAPR
jgi:hypothetical protein